MPLETLLEVKGLHTQFTSKRGTAHVLDGIDLSLTSKRIMGLVGETGSGKTVTAYSILQLIKPPGRITAGEVWFQGRDLMKLNQEEMARIRGHEISMVFQQPRASLNPVFPIGRVLTHILRTHRSFNNRQAQAEGEHILARVGLPDPREVMRKYPHELSGGMCQRVMIAMALACRPQLLLADEPTTALDVTIQAQIVDLLLSLREQFGLTQLLITHDLGLVGELCDDVTVMYAGEVMELAPVTTLFDQPSHPYSQGLLASRPNYKKKKTLYSIPGNVPDLVNPPQGCRFHPRCSMARTVCTEQSPPWEQVSEGHWVRCHFWRDALERHA